MTFQSANACSMTSSCVDERMESPNYSTHATFSRTIDSLRAGNIMSVLNIVMQLRKCCNHPNLFEPRPVVSPCVSSGVSLLQPRTAELAQELDPKSAVMSLMSLIGSRTNSASLLRLGDPAALLAEIKQEAEAPLPKITGFKFTADQKFKTFSTYVAPAPEVGKLDEPNFTGYF